MNQIPAEQVYLEQTLFLGLDTFEERQMRELEPVVRLGLRNLSDEPLEVTVVSPELESVEVENVSDGVVEEGRVMENDD